MAQPRRRLYRPGVDLLRVRGAARRFPRRTRPVAGAAQGSPLQGEGILQTIAEVSVAFAGFTGVVVAFGRRPGQGGSSPDSHAFRAMLASSLQALLFAILPFLLAACGLAAPGLWRVASAVLLVGLAFGAFMDVRYARGTDRGQWTRFDRALGSLVPLGGGLAMVAQILNVTGAIARPFAPYLAGLLFFLVFSSAMFVRLLTAPNPGGPA